MGAVTVMRPDLFKVVVAGVPFRMYISHDTIKLCISLLPIQLNFVVVFLVDVLTTMLDDSIPLTIIEREEWGNPYDKVTTILNVKTPLFIILTQNKYRKNMST